MKLQSLKPFLIIVLLLVSSASYCQFTNALKPPYSLHGKVRSCLTTGYNLKKDDSTDHQIDIFDSVLFNNKGQVIKAFKSNVVRGADINKRTINTFKYDIKGNVTEQLYYDTDGKAQVKIVYSYLASKNKVSLRIFFLQGKDSSRISDSFKVTASGRILEKYHPIESFAQDVKYQYEKTVYKYNKKGLRVEEVEYDLNGSETSQRFNKYNQNNDLAETNYIWLKDQRGNEYITFTYTKYDKHHNWLVKNMFLNGHFHSVTERRITYYK